MDQDVRPSLGVASLGGYHLVQPINRVVVVDSTWSSCRIQYTSSAISSSQQSVENWLSKQQNGVRGASGTREGQGSELLLCIYNSNKPGTKPVTPPVDTATRGVETQPL